MFWFRICLTSLVTALAVVTAQSDAAAAGLVLPVPVVTIYPGEVIEESMVAERAVTSPRIGRLLVVPDKSDLIGKVARRTLLPGQPVTSNAVEIPDLVPRGAPVTVVFRERGLTILAQAKSLEAGSAG